MGGQNNAVDEAIRQEREKVELETETTKLYGRTAELIEKGLLKEAVDEIFGLVRKANKYFDSRQPWITRDTDTGDCCNTLFTCVQVIADLAVLLYPFLPFSSAKICGWLQLSPDWKKLAEEESARLDKACTYL